MNCPVNFLNNISLNDVQMVLFISLVLAIIFKPSLVKPYQTQIILFLIILCMVSSDTVEGNDQDAADEKGSDEKGSDEKSADELVSESDKSNTTNTTIDPCPNDGSCINNINTVNPTWNDNGTMCYNPAATPSPVCVPYTKGICPFKQCIAPSEPPPGPGPGPGPVPGKIPTTSQYEKRNITVINNCEKDIQLVSTLDDSEFMSQNESACNGGYTGKDGKTLGTVSGGTNGSKCTDFKLYRTPAIPSGQTTSFDESLYMVDTPNSNNGSGGCTASTYCRPGVNYQAVYTNDENVGADMDYQGKIEFTFGGYANTADDYDGSAMLLNGCAMHSLLGGASFGYSDSNDQCVINNLDDSFTSNQTLINKKELKNALVSPPTDPSNKYYGYKDILMDKYSSQPYTGIQGNLGCFKGGKNTTDNIDCIQMNSPTSDSEYACGYPLFYTHGGVKYMVSYGYKGEAPGQPKDINFIPPPTNIATPTIGDYYNNPSPVSNSDEILTSLRNELYECVAIQNISYAQKTSGKNSIPNNPDIPNSTFIPYSIAPNNSCKDNSYLEENISIPGISNNIYMNYDGNDSFNCDIQAGGPPYYYSTNAAETCSDGYMFAYDDSKATYTCNPSPKSSNPTDYPGYTITFCPNNNQN